MNIVPCLDHAEGEGPPLYWELVAALERLLNDELTSPILMGLREEAGIDEETRPVAITQQNVAIESGKPSRRKHISGNGTFPKLAQYISSLRSTHGVSENTTRKIERQAEEIASLEQKVRVLRSRVLEAITRRDEAEGALLEAQGQIVRLKRRKVD